MDVSFGLNSHHPITLVVVRAFIGSVFELRCSGAVQQIKYSLWPSVLKLKRTTFPPFNVCNWYYCQRALDCFFYFLFFIVATTAKMDVRLFFHLVLNWDVKADRNGARLPHRLDGMMPASLHLSQETLCLVADKRTQWKEDNISIL